ncbi:S1C family serine protease [Microbacterium sp. No. 7]|uniref:S1C family serine protease n=1 Tax=Microbacterium sp. No. 7 TaxID=1714373 RepID=UPI0006ECD7AC|nr:S1C family serine protease [Microbacterium sp. No. 7]ALJ20502.1 serine protease [Microbacterium sp. No. 7]
MHREPQTRRVLSFARGALVASLAVALSGCGAAIPVVDPSQSAPPAASSVGFDDVQTATVYIKGKGTFIDPGSVAPAENRWIGSGFIISESGIAVTNNHVVSGAGTLDVAVGGEDDVNAKVLGSSECLDLAVIQLDEGTYPYLSWHEGEIKTALDVYSAGFPAGAAEQFTLTRGIVSKADFPLDTEWASLQHVIEHDARVRGGNSGGPLIDASGAVVGINFAGENTLDYNYAIHRDVALEVVDKMAGGEAVLTLGINAHAWSSGDGSLYGVWAQSVRAGGPADKAGIKPGDLVLKLAGVSLASDATLSDYCQVLETQGPETTMTVEVYRPSTDELLEGQVNGEAIEVVQTGVFGGGEDVATGGFVLVADDANVLEVSVPRDWAQVDGAGFTDSNGATWYSLSAAPDLQAFFASASAPGVQLMASADAARTPDDLLTQMTGQFGACSAIDVAQPYDDGYYAGVFSTWDCSGTYSVVISSLDAASNNILLVTQLFTDFEQTDALDELLSTFYAFL